MRLKKQKKNSRKKPIIGLGLCLFSIFLLVAFCSYCFTWDEDQGLIFNWTIRDLFSSTIVVHNKMGKLGAIIAHSFFYKGLGIASFLFIWICFVLGLNIFFGRKVFRPYKHIFLNILISFYLATLCGFVFYDFSFPFGGKIGRHLAEWLHSTIGFWGQFLVLIIFIPLMIIIFNDRVSIIHKIVLYMKNLRHSLRAHYKTIVQDSSDNGPVSASELVDHEASMFISNVYEKDSLSHASTREGTDHNVMQDEMVFEFMEKQDMNLNDKVTEESLLLEDKGDHAMIGNMNKTDSNHNAADLILKDKNLMSSDNVFVQAPQEVSSPVMDTPFASSNSTMKTEGAYDTRLDLPHYRLPPLDLLETYAQEHHKVSTGELNKNKDQIVNTLKNYDIAIDRIMATVGPTVTLYEMVPMAGVRISKIKNLEDDIALSLAALGIRIIAPIPGRGTVGIEVPNVKKSIVGIRSILSSEKFHHPGLILPIALGKKIDNKHFIVDLSSMPHLLMAGATGQGKSVGINAILMSLLYKKHPSELKFVMIDPKKVELSIYRVIENHYLAKLPDEDDSIITDTKKAIYTLNALCVEMDKRYDLLKNAGVRNIREYNEKFKNRRLNPEKGHRFLPFIVLVIDEFADLIMTAGKEVEMPIARLAQLARAIGIHLIVATQRPSVNIITGIIKANFPARIAFKVSSKVDSRTILDCGGAEQLIGKGDMLISYNGHITRVQCAFIDTPEVDRVTAFIAEQQGYASPFLLPEYVNEKDKLSVETTFNVNDRDVLFEEVAYFIVKKQIGSTSLVQRHFKLGYNRAGRLMDQMEQLGIVGASQGSKPREVRVKTEEELTSLLN